jgi:hypothetical protein
MKRFLKKNQRDAEKGGKCSPSFQTGYEKKP